MGVISELIRGDIYYWGQLMAGAMVGSIPIVVAYVFFMDYYVSGLTAGGRQIAPARRTANWTDRPDPSRGSLIHGILRCGTALRGRAAVNRANCQDWGLIQAVR